MPSDKRPIWSRRRTLQGLAAAGLSAASTPLLAQDRPSYPRLRRGINIHNLLNWPRVNQVAGQVRYEWPPFQAKDYQIDDQHLRLLASAGFNFIRLTVDPSIFIVSEEDKRPVLHEHARKVVMQLLAAGFNVVFDLHPVAVNPNYKPEVLVTGQANPAFAGYVAMVERVAMMLRDFPADRVALELFNEPPIGSTRDAPKWQAMAEDLHAAARASAPQLPLVLGGISWNSSAGLIALNPEPFKSSNMLYTFHYYDPHIFTHQSVNSPDTAFLTGLKWPVTVANIDEAQAAALARINAAGKLDATAKEHARAEMVQELTRLRQNPPGAAQVILDFANVSRWAIGHRIPADRIFMGEFGCMATALGTPLGNDRLQWLQEVRVNCEKAGFGWAFWAYKSNVGFSSMQLMRDDNSIDPATGAALGLRSGA